jgi:hypothetical protein
MSRIPVYSGPAVFKIKANENFRVGEPVFVDQFGNCQHGKPGESLLTQIGRVISSKGGNQLVVKYCGTEFSEVSHVTQSFFATVVQWQQTPIEKPNGHRVWFTIEKPYEPNTLEVYLDGLRLAEKDDFTEYPPNRFLITNINPPSKESWLQCRYEPPKGPGIEQKEIPTFGVT